MNYKLKFNDDQTIDFNLNFIKNWYIPVLKDNFREESYKKYSLYLLESDNYVTDFNDFNLNNEFKKLYKFNEIKLKNNKIDFESFKELIYESESLANVEMQVRNKKIFKIIEEKRKEEYKKWANKEQVAKEYCIAFEEIIEKCYENNGMKDVFEANPVELNFETQLNNTYALADGLVKSHQDLDDNECAFIKPEFGFDVFFETTLRLLFKDQNGEIKKERCEIVFYVPPINDVLALERFSQGVVEKFNNKFYAKFEELVKEYLPLKQNQKKLER